MADDRLYREGTLLGGLAYSDDDLRTTFSWLTEVRLRLMQDMPDGGEVFGRSFLWAALFRCDTETRE